MKYKSEKTLRRAKKAFSLIELMIVIVIIGALTAIILPQFDISEAEAKDAGCDASNYGTLAQLTKFRSLHGVFPANMHTGLESNVSGAKIMGYSAYADGSVTTTSNSAIPSFTAANLSNSSSTVIVALDTAYASTDEENEQASAADSLREAGIIALAYGGFPKDLDATAADDFTPATFKAVLSSTWDAEASGGAASAGSTYVATIVDNWYEEWTIGADGKAEAYSINTTSTPISINGIPLPFYIYNDPQAAFADAKSTDIGDVTDSDDLYEDGVVIPLFIAPTVDWEHWYDANGSENEAKIGVAQTGACPWLEANAEFRYYIAVFKAYNDGTKAKLLGTMCPEGGSLNP